MQAESKQLTLRVQAVGDCNTWGIIDPPIGNTILDKFCRQLEKSGYRTTSQNLGCGMATSREGIQRMRLDAETADIVTINFGLVDTWVTTIPKLYILYYPDNILRKRLRKLLKFVKRRLRSAWARRFVPIGPVVSIEEYESNICEMISLTRTKNPQATVLLWGSPPVQSDPERNANLDRYNRRLEAIALQRQALYVNTTSLVSQLSAKDTYLDEVHLNEAATQLIAEQMAITYQNQQLAAAG